MRLFVLSVCLALVALCFTATANPVINEFLASNSGGLEDEDGNTPDWIELYNPTEETIDLVGYTLTDDGEMPASWTFPSRVMIPGSFLIVFASAKDRLGAELHTNFRLGETEYLALADPSGTVVSEFAPTYPEQFENVAYGVAQSGNRSTTSLIAREAAGRVLVPTQDIGTSWRDVDFDDTSWASATTGIGYETGNGYQALFGTNADLESEMFARSTSVYLRIPFQINEISSVSELVLRMNYDDGFVAWINGVQVAAENAPAALTWTSEATENHEDESALVFQNFDASEAVPRLKEGTNLLTIQGLNVGNDSSDMLILPELDAVEVSEGQSGEVGYLERATPGALNGASFEGFVSDTKFSVDRGFYDSPIEVAITTATEGAEIRYTTNGNAPTATSGLVYSEPIQIARTTTLRAAAFKQGLVATNVDTVSYFFLADVILQDSPPVGWPRGSLNGQVLDYGMDPDVVNEVHSDDEIVSALKAVPTLSITTPIDNLFGAARGIYVHSSSDGRAWERPASLELLNPSGSKGFQIDAGLRIRGGFSRSSNNPKHSFRLFFRRDYGEGKLRYPMFGDEGADAFDNLDLRTSQNYSWAFGGDGRNTMLRDVFTRDLQGRMGRPYTRSRYYHLYLNGQYWGLYQTQERAEASYAETYLKGKKEDFDVIKSFGSVTDGTRDAHSRLWREATAGFASDTRYWNVQGLNPDGTPNPSAERLLDVDNLIDYMILTFYSGDRDGPGSRFTQPNPNNFYTIYNRTNPDGFKYFEHDSEHSLGTGENDMTFPFTTGSQQSQFNPHWLHERLVGNANYRRRFAELVQKHLFNGGLLTPENAVAGVERRAAQIDQAIIAESARWGDAQRANDPYTRDDWLAAVDDLKRWILVRRETVIEQLQARGWIPDTRPPAFSVAPGDVEIGTELLFLGEGGEVFYTLDGTDPQDSPQALSASPAGEVTTVLLAENDPARALVPTNASFGSSWRALDFDDGAWIGGRTGVGYDNNTGYRDVIVLDVDASMNGENTSVFVRVLFDVPDPSVYTNLRLRIQYDDGFAAFLNGVRVASANSPSTLVWNSSATAGHSDSEALEFVPFDMTSHLGELRAGSNVLAIHGLNDSLGSSDMLITPRVEGGRTLGGTAVVLPAGRTVVKARIRDGNEWSALSEGSFLVGGVLADSSNVVLSEIMYHPANPTEAEVAAGFTTGDFEYLELLNLEGVPVDLTALFFLRGVNFTFADGSLLQPHARGLIVSNPEAFALRYGGGLPVLGVFDGSLDDSGERLALVRSWDDGIQDLRYNDRGDWPEAADGSGRSLVLIEPDTNPDPNLAESWLPSGASQGAPGLADPGTVIVSAYQAWKDRWEVDDDLADPDRDGLVNLLEYALRRLPLQPDSKGAVGVTRSPIELEHAINPGADDVEIVIEISEDLKLWTTLDFAPEVDDTELKWRYRLPEDEMGYVRLKVNLIE